MATAKPQPQEELTVLPHEQPLPPRVDMITGAAFLALAIGIIVVSWMMPTYLDQKGAIYEAPALVPMLHGVIIGILSLWLIARSLRRGRQGLIAASPWVAAGPNDGGMSDPMRLAVASALALMFTVGLITRMPFWLASAIFIAVFTIVFEWRPGQPWRTRLRRSAEAVLLGAVASAGIFLVFEEIFLVRLP